MRRRHPMIRIAASLLLPIFLMFASVASSPGQPPVPEAGGVLINPTAEDMVLLYYALQNVSPPLEKWQSYDPAVQAANEFQRPHAIAAFKQRISERIAGLRNVREINLVVTGRISNYDPDSQGFYIEGLTNGAFLNFGAFGQSITVQVSNGDDWSIWQVSAEQAERLLNKNGGSRAVLIGYRLTVGDAAKVYPGDLALPATIKAMRLTTYDRASVLGTRGG